MKEFPAYQAPVLSFFSGDFYRHVAKRWGGIGFFYIMMMSIASLAGSDLALYKLVDGYVDLFLSKVPPLTIKDNKLYLDVPSPYVIDLSGEQGKKARIVFDTTGKMKSLADSNSEVLVTSENIIMKDSLEEEKVVPLSSLSEQGIPDTKIDKEKLSQARGAVDQLVVTVMAGLAAASLFGHFLLSLIYGGLGCIMSSLTEANLGYGACVRVAVIAMTPGIIISTILSLLNLWPVLFIWGLISVPVTLGYIYFGCASAAKPDAI